MGSGRFSMMGDLEPRMLKAISVGILHLIVLQLSISVQVEAEIITFVVPENILKGNETTMLCNFNDDINDIITFSWSSSTQEETNRANANKLLSYNGRDDTWTDFTNGSFTATMDRSGKSSVLKLKSAQLDDQKKYWCIISVFDNIWENTGFAIVNALDTSATDLLWLGSDEFESSPLTDGTYQFQCRVIGAKPAPTITWTFGEDIFQDPDPTTSPNKEESRLFDSSSTYSVTINSEFEEKDLTCKATVPADETGVSDTVTITRDNLNECDYEELHGCNAEKEDCEDTDSGYICKCKEEYTGSKCAKKGTVKSKKVTWGVNREFNDALLDSSSDKYIEEAEDQTNAMDGVFNSTKGYMGCSVIQFSKGSIVTDFQILLDIESELGESYIESTIQTAIDNGDLSSIGVIDGSVEVSDLNECDEELHDCSENEDCEDTDSGYICQIKDGLTSDQKLYIGLGVAGGVVLICGIIGACCYVNRKPKDNKVGSSTEMKDESDNKNKKDKDEEGDKEDAPDDDKQN